MVKAAAVCTLLLTLAHPWRGVATLRLEVTKATPETLKAFLQGDEKVPYDGVFIAVASPTLTTVSDVKRKVVVLLISERGTVIGSPVPLLRAGEGELFFAPPPGTKSVVLAKPQRELQKIHGGERVKILCKEKKK